jgi:hypothetical protein
MHFVNILFGLFIWSGSWSFPQLPNPILIASTTRAKSKLSPIWLTLALDIQGVAAEFKCSNAIRGNRQNQQNVWQTHDGQQFKFLLSLCMPCQAW